MKLLEDRILQDGQVRPGNVLKVDCFLNHQLDVDLLDKIGGEFYRIFKNDGVNKILTIEASGIAIACMTARYFNVPVVFAKKAKSKNIDGEVYTSTVHSYTYGRDYDITLSKKFLSPSDKVLILDDSTSAVDTKTDAKIRAGLASYLPNTTKLIIAQRISSVQDADRIIVMEGGRIAQIGNHDELLKTSEIYRETFTSQNKMSAEGEEAVEADTEASATQAQTQEGGEAHE